MSNPRTEWFWQRLGLMTLALILLVIAGGAGSDQLAFRAGAHLLLTLLFASWLIGRLRRRQFLPATPLNGPIFAGAAVIALASAFALDPRMAAEHAWWPLIHALIFFYCAAQIQRGRQRVLFEVLFLIGAVTVVVAGAELAGWLMRAGAAVDFGALLRGQAELPPVAPMLSKPLYASTLLAGFVTPQVVIAFGWAATAQRRAHRLALAGLGAGLALVLLATGSRGGLLALAAAIITVLVLRLAPALWAARHGAGAGRKRTLAGIAAILLVGLAALGLVLLIGRSAARSSGDEIRVSLWANAASAARDYPLLGVGTGEVGRAFRLYRAPGEPTDFVHRQAHNLLLNTAAEEGIAGLAVLVWMSVALLIAWVRQRRAASGSRRALRLELVLAALVAIALQAQFDVFYVTPFMAMVALLAAYAVTPPGEVPAPGRAGKAGAWISLILVIGYGVAWIPIHRAEAAFERAAWQSDRASADQAAALDPALRLYPLQVAYLEGRAAETDPARLPEAISRYQAALASEPTWDSGWMLLAGLYEQAGQIDEALAALDRAREVNPASPADWNWARIADAHDAAPDQEIVAAYARAIGQLATPRSPEWAATPRRLQAIEAVFAQANPRLRFLLAQAYFPERMAGLVADDPQTADDWWVTGQYALTEGDALAAWGAFDQGVRVNPDREIGEYYAARARAGEALGGEYAAQARRDRAMADLLITWQEASSEAYDADRNFEQVLFLRSGNFRLPDQMIPPG